MVRPITEALSNLRIFEVRKITHRSLIGHQRDDWCLRALLSFHDRTPSSLTSGPSSSLTIYKVRTKACQVSTNCPIFQIKSVLYSELDKVENILEKFDSFV
jgi:hypothetical protein